LEERVKVVVEHVTAMPGQGVTSMFNFGQSFGVIKGSMCSTEITNLFCQTYEMEKTFQLD
jgi:crossover junction endodeoxyribonuclease RuvC